jgi:hypothetical protein
VEIDKQINLFIDSDSDDGPFVNIVHEFLSDLLILHHRRHVKE